MQEIPEGFETKVVSQALSEQPTLWGCPGKVKIQDLYLHFSMLEIRKVDLTSARVFGV